MDRKASVTGPYKFCVFLICILVLIGPQHGSGATVSVTPNRASSFYAGVISLQIDGLTNGETVRVEKFIDVNTNNAVNAIDLMVESFFLTDNQSIAVGGVTNRHRPFDLNPVNGAITAELPFYDMDVDHLVARYIYRVSSLTGRFTASNGLFRITNSADAQLVRGLARNSGTNVPYAMVAALQDVPDGPRYIAGALAASNGLFTLNLPVGTYRLIGVKRGFVGNFDTGPTINLTAGANVSNNVPLIVATRSISGRLVDAADTNAGIAGVQMFVSSDPLFALAFTDTSGNFSVPVQPGVWRLGPEERTLATLGYLGLDDDFTADASAGNVSGLLIAVPKATALIYGTLKTTSDSPIAGLEVYASSPADLFNARSVTDTAGRFFLGVTADSWWVQARAEELSERGFLNGGNIQTNLSAGQAARIDLTAVPFAAFLQGRVIDETGAAVADAKLRVSDYEGSYSYGVTAADGSFSIGVGIGTWYLQIESDENGPTFAHPEISFAVTNTSNFTNISYRVLRATNSIAGFVRNYAGVPIWDLTVYAFGDVDGVRYNISSVNTQPDGSYVLQVANGDWQVGIECFRAESRGYNCAGVKSVAVAGTNISLDFTLLPLPGPTVIDSLTLLPNRRLRFRVTGTAGYDYAIDSSTDLQNWTPLFTTNSVAPPFEFTDMTSTNSTRFYRARLQAP